MFENLNKGTVSTIQEGVDLLELQFVKLKYLLQTPLT